MITLHKSSKFLYTNYGPNFLVKLSITSIANDTHSYDSSSAIILTNF